ncbi:hypothetical protein MCELHM10_00774 [Paracoccaceae bacterium]
MSLREFGQSTVDHWNSYVTEITTQNVLDWSIGNLFLTAFLGIFFGGFIWAAIEVLSLFVWEIVAKAWKKTGLPYTMARLDKRFGPVYSGLIMVAGTIAFFILLGLIFSLVEIAQS